MAAASDLAQDGWLLIGLPGVVAFVTALATTSVARWNAATEPRRVRYAEAVATLVAWIEFPYRVRRRTSDEPATLAALADRGHDLQERLAFDEAWIRSESAIAGDAYRAARSEIGRLVGRAVRDAWEFAPVGAPAEMNLNGWGPAQEAAPFVDALQDQIDRRLTWRRWKRRRD